MSYQVRHKEWGIFQGQFLGLGLWHPMSEEPEQGFYEFQSKADAQEFCGTLRDVPTEMLQIEPFNKVQSDRCIAHG